MASGRKRSPKGAARTRLGSRARKPKRAANERRRTKPGGGSVARARAASRKQPKRGAKARRTAGAKARRTAGAKPRRATATRTVARRVRARLRAVPRRRSARPKAPPAFPQAAGASARNELLFRMVRARAAVLAAVQGMSAAAAEQPLAEGKWSCRETILHLVTRDRARLREMEAALRGLWPSWNGSDSARQAQINDQDLVPLRRLSWEDAVRLLLTTRQQLMEAVESIPEEPSEVWSESHPLGWMFQRLPAHDLHHADIIKSWRTRPGA
jgi:uncharacterized damage-inducible protein DinB